MYGHMSKYPGARALFCPLATMYREHQYKMAESITGVRTAMGMLLSAKFPHIFHMTRSPVNKDGNA